MGIEIIAEVGECFNGSMEVAKELIMVASKSRCDTVKFQILDMHEVAKDDPEYDWFAKLELDKEKLAQLIQWAEEMKIGILFTPVSIRTAQLIVNLGCRRVKIASSFINKMDFLEFIRNNFEEIIVSTGMASLDEVQIVLDLFSNKKLSVLHCVSEYPTGPLLEKRGLCALDESDVNLQMMNMLRSLYPQCKIGYSDHTSDILAPIVAASMGADIIEKHITLNRELPINNYVQGLDYMGTDHVLSIEPNELNEMVTQIRRVENIRGQWKWQRSEGEKILFSFLKNRYKERE